MDIINIVEFILIISILLWTIYIFNKKDKD